MDICLYGLGQCSKEFIELLNGFESDIKIIMAMDSYSKEGGLFYGIDVVSKSSLKETDKVVIAIASPNSVLEIKQYLINTLRLNNNNIFHYLDFIQEVRKRRIIEKYKNNTGEYGEIISYLQSGNPLTVRNQYANPKKTEYKVFEDEKLSRPYVIYFGKKLYMPKDFLFDNHKGSQIVTNVVENDQYVDSPHLYIKEDHFIAFRNPTGF